MGNMYVNICLRDASAARLAAALRGFEGDDIHIGPERGGWTCLVSEALDWQDLPVIQSYGRALSALPGGAALAVLNHDDDMLLAFAFRDGAEIAAYSSCPGALSGDPARQKPELHGPEGFAGLSEDATAGQIEELLLAEPLPVFAVELHGALVARLGLPEYSVGMGHRYMRAGSAQERWTPFAAEPAP